VLQHGLGLCMAFLFLEAYIYKPNHICICSYNFSIQYSDNVIQFGAVVVSL